MSGAELTALISNAAMHAIRSVILNADKQSIRDVRIEREHIQHALHAISTQKATID
jgi:SpoVK/Ycf46/Vps4 family AAA+-type ATPase